MRHIQHVTLNTGHSRRSPRSEVGDEAIAYCAALLAGLARSGRVPVDLDDSGGWTMTGAVRGKCMVASLFFGDAPVLSFAVASRQRCGAPTWQAMFASSPDELVGDPQSQPQTPWLATRLYMMTIPPRAMDALDAAADLSRCVAWSFLEWA